MKKKSMFIVTFSLVILLGAFVLYDKNSPIKNNLPNGENGSSNATWISHYYDDTEMIKEADLIIIGKIVGSYTEQRADMVFTRQIVEVQKTLKANSLVKADLELTSLVAEQSRSYLEESYLPESNLPMIQILQTGGELNGMYTKPFLEAPLLESGEQYVFLLEQALDENFLPTYYVMMGGYQGVGEVIDNKIVFSKQTNDVFKLLSNQNVDQVTSIVDNVIKKYGDTSYDKKGDFQGGMKDVDTEGRERDE